MKKYIVALLLLLATSSDAAVFFSSNWDTGTPDACWPCKQTSCASTFDSWYQSSEPPEAIANAGVSTTVAHSGTKSFRQFRGSGLAYGCDIAADLPTLPTTIYLRFYLYMTTNWEGTWTNSVSWMHWIFTNSALSNTGFRINLATNGEIGECPSGHLCIIPEGDGGEQWWSEEASCDGGGYWGTTYIDTVNLKDYIGQWVCLEYKMQISGSNVILTEWVNGVQTRGPCTGPGQNTSSFNKIIFSGWENSGYEHDADFYIDDIVVADAYIGPLSTSKRTLFRR